MGIIDKGLIPRVDLCHLKDKILGKNNMEELKAIVHMGREMVQDQTQEEAEVEVD